MDAPWEKNMTFHKQQVDFHLCTEQGLNQQQRDTY